MTPVSPDAIPQHDSSNSSSHCRLADSNSHLGQESQAVDAFTQLHHTSLEHVCADTSEDAERDALNATMDHVSQETTVAISVAPNFQTVCDILYSRGRSAPIHKFCEPRLCTHHRHNIALHIQGIPASQILVVTMRFVDAVSLCCHPSFLMESHAVLAPTAVMKLHNLNGDQLSTDGFYQVSNLRILFSTAKHQRAVRLQFRIQVRGSGLEINPGGTIITTSQPFDIASTPHVVTNGNLNRPRMLLLTQP
jgi:hypothetical protein